jgi:mRNA interferase RelE/StbE
VSYRVELTRSAVRELRRIPIPYHDAITRALLKLQDDPRPNGCKKLVGGSGQWRIRVGSFRVIYEIQDVIRLVRIERVTDRKDAYR